MTVAATQAHRTPTRSRRAGFSRSSALVILGVVALLGCSVGGPTGGGVRDDPARIELTIFAAASLKGALEDVAGAYAAVAPEVALTFSTGASSALRAQIEQGAPADVLLSADTTQPAALVDDGHTVGAPRIFAGNQLGIIVPSGNPAAIATPADLARPGVKIVAAGDAVPITAYATSLVANLASADGYPRDFDERYAANVVSREDDVGAVVAKIELGEGDAAIVYRTDAVASDSIATVEIPPEANVIASYAAVIIAGTPHADAATAFLDWLIGPAGQAVLARRGFSAPPP